MVSRTFVLSDPVLHLPMLDTDVLYYIAVTAGDGQRIGEFYVGLTSGMPDFWCPLYLGGYKRQTVTLSTDDADAPADLFSGIVQGGRIEDRSELYPGVYREPTRQQVHFSSRRGWLNDPNGAVCVDGAFHMCYQHNPFGPYHGGVNVSWGLAVSPDGVHFRESPDAIRPRDSLTHIASGSAIVDRNNVLGMGSSTILAVYTALESRMFKGRQSVGTRGQMLEYSTDGGYTFTPIAENPILSVPAGESWRDPKILSMDDGSLCIAVYETYEGEDCVSFYSSRDGRRWAFESRTRDLFECPDLFPIRSEDGETVWALYGAGGVVRFGKFKEYTFHENGDSHPLDYGSATYAGQTFNCCPDAEGRYHIAWFRDPSQGWDYDPARANGIPFSQSMTLLCRFTLRRVQGTWRLLRNPLAAFSGLRQGEGETFSLRGGEKAPLAVPSDCELVLDGASPARLTVDGEGFAYDPASETLAFTSGKSCTRVSAGALRVRIVTDTHSVEFFVDGGIGATFASLAPEKELVLEEGAADGVKWTLDSIWDAATERR